MRYTALAFFLVTAGGFGRAADLPVTSVESLAGQKIMFPAGLVGKPAVCVFGFSQDAGDKTKEWMKRLYQDEVNAWSVANLERAPSLVRGMIKSGMRKGTPQPLQEHSLIMIKDEQTWKRALGAKDEKLPVVVVLDATGKVVWTYEGAFGDEAYRELRGRLGVASK
jgi:hypothetical protein